MSKVGNSMLFESSVSEALKTKEVSAQQKRIAELKEQVEIAKKESGDVVFMRNLFLGYVTIVLLAIYANRCVGCYNAHED